VSRISQFLENRLRDGGKVLNLTAQKDILKLISVRSCISTGAIVWLELLGNLKEYKLGIKATTFQLVA
jgi:hypothetical protein